MTQPDEPIRYMNEVVLGHREKAEGLIWPFGIFKKYPRIQIGGSRMLVTRYICQSIYGDAPTPKHEAAHSCGKGHLGCVNPMHLEWKTHAQNQADRVQHGTHSRGERHGNARLTERQVAEIRGLAGSITHLALAERYGVARITVKKIVNRQLWRHLPDPQLIPLAK